MNTNLKAGIVVRHFLLRKSV